MSPSTNVALPTFLVPLALTWAGLASASSIPGRGLHPAQGRELGSALSEGRSISTKASELTTVRASAWGDYDGDGFEDLYRAGLRDGDQLLRNRGDGGFEDVTVLAGLPRGQSSDFACWQDCDGDGRLDLLVGAAAGVHLWRATSSGTFEDITALAGLPMDAAVLTACFLDYDRDGRTDLFLELLGSDQLYRNVGAMRFEQALSATMAGTLVDERAPVYTAGNEVAPGPSTADLPGGMVGDPREQRRSSGSGPVRSTLDPGRARGGAVSKASTPFGSAGPCAETLRDQASGSCLQASSEPRLGALYPLSSDLFVSSAGSVGIGTGNPSPSNRLEVAGRLQVVRDNLPLVVRGTWSAPANAVGIRLENKDGAPVFQVWQDGKTQITGMTETGALHVAGNASVSTLTIRGGADFAEPFPVTGSACEPGSVVVFAPEVPGRVQMCSRPADTRVAGVVSGAGGIRPGLMLSQEGHVEGDVLVALMGQVYVKCTAENGPILPGDRLVTSSTPGHAMRASDGERVEGALIGKAVTDLPSGQGLVLVLVNRQ